MRRHLCDVREWCWQMTIGSLGCGSGNRGSCVGGAGAERRCSLGTCSVVGQCWIDCRRNTNSTVRMALVDCIVNLLSFVRCHSVCWDTLTKGIT